MIIKQSSLGVMNEATSFLKEATYLTESESVYHPAMIAIRENSRLGVNIVRLEDLVEYAFSNGIDDGAYAISQVCETNEIDPTTIAFSVDETSLIEDAEMVDTAKQLMEAGAKVYAAPLPSTDMAHIMAEACVDAMTEAEYEEEGNSILEAFVMDDFDTIVTNEAVREKIESGISKARNKLGVGKGEATSVMDKVKSTMKEANGKSKAWIAKKVSAFRSMYAKWMKKAQAETDAGKASVFKKVALKIMQCIDYLMKKIQKAVK